MTEGTVRSQSKPQLTAISIDLLAESILPVANDTSGLGAVRFAGQMVLTLLVESVWLINL